MSSRLEPVAGETSRIHPGRLTTNGPSSPCQPSALSITASTITETPSEIPASPRSRRPLGPPKPASGSTTTHHTLRVAQVSQLTAQLPSCPGTPSGCTSTRSRNCRQGRTSATGPTVQDHCPPPQTPPDHRPHQPRVVSQVAPHRPPAPPPTRHAHPQHRCPDTLSSHACPRSSCLHTLFDITRALRDPVVTTANRHCRSPRVAAFTPRFIPVRTRSAFTRAIFTLHQTRLNIGLAEGADVILKGTPVHTNVLVSSRAILRNRRLRHPPDRPPPATSPGTSAPQQPLISTTASGPRQPRPPR